MADIMKSGATDNINIPLVDWCMILSHRQGWNH